ncbi:hypothetical protein J5J83_19735 [Azoarcus sp. L1K30]|uniref:hypothetical protein n=1 Tax=Azoarcus sp. L1K30 TaxID=2820277 RepID=UPI001B81AE0F|nr:hypothetical protein [Azoarcus sp. L1K30]MBR0568359.1 hypothetical protein [Azoarcus sp. L1K30]
MMKSKRSLAAVLSVAAAICSSSALATSNYQDWWSNPGQIGSGFNIGHQGDTLAVAWYYFDDTGKSTYMLLAGKLVNGALDGKLERATLVNGVVQREYPGTARISFSSENSATFTYSYDGKTGTIPLQRFSYATPSIAGRWQYAGTYSRTGCTIGQNNESGSESGVAQITSTGSNGYRMTMYGDNGGSCSYAVTMPQAGSVFSGSGTYSCSNGVAGSITINKLRTVDGFVTVDYSARMTVGETCKTTGRLGGVK